MKTPSKNVVAAMWVLQQLDADGNAPTLEAKALGEMANSRVSEAKAEQVRVQIDKLTKKLLERCEKIVQKFETPPVPGKSRTS